ncbi:hypothetical protein [Enterobacter roggenkampii]|uniref:hypothetical protein n=1 Tax=Enterobacter roggenkampii TaxID=1812935 RepID=UPI001C701EE7|nr:hypothetical protein [Enterobacter roggenkampii]MBW9442061.1 hypothetical protein [Enterobacter roggenkampii]
MMSLWDALRMNMMISYQELVRTFHSNDRGFMQANGKMIGNDVQDTDATQGFELT